MIMRGLNITSVLSSVSHSTLYKRKRAIENWGWGVGGGGGGFLKKKSL